VATGGGLAVTASSGQEALLRFHVEQHRHEFKYGELAEEPVRPPERPNG